MTTQILTAKEGKVSDEMYQVSRIEKIDIETIRHSIENGKIIILKNKQKDIVPVAIGDGLKTKVFSNLSKEFEKVHPLTKQDRLRVIEEAGADVLFDLSDCDLFNSREEVIDNSKIPVITSPIIDNISFLEETKLNVKDLTKKEIFDSVIAHCEGFSSGVILNCAVNKFFVEQLENYENINDLININCALCASYIKTSNKENPLYENFDELLDILAKNDIVLALSSGLKCNNIVSNFNSIQNIEYAIFSQLVKKARSKGVQVILQTPKFLSIEKIHYTIKTIKELTCNSPLYSDGLLTSNCCIGNENLSSAIGSALAAYYGVNLLNCCAKFEKQYPNNSSMLKKTITTSKISAHCADLANKNAKEVQLNEISLSNLKNKNFDELFKNSAQTTSNLKAEDFEDKSEILTEKLVEKYF